MSAYFCTPLMQRIKLLAALIAFTTLLAASGAAQSRQTNSNTAQAVLHIQINVVPMVMLPPVQAQPAENSSNVSFNFPVNPQRVSVTRQVRPYPTAPEPGAVVRTITVVPE